MAKRIRSKEDNHYSRYKARLVGSDGIYVITTTAANVSMAKQKIATLRQSSSDIILDVRHLQWKEIPSEK